MPKLIIIVGPTSSGKTKLAVELARKFNGEIVSADSRQVYRGMDIGTGKDLKMYNSKSLALSDATKLSFDRSIRYHLIDIVNPRTNFTLAQYQKRAYQAIEDILRRSKVPILVGGTGLYVQAVVDGYILPQAPPDPKLRARLTKLSLTQLRAKLKKLDPATYRVIDKNNRRRLERAIEICLVSGIPFSKQRTRRIPPYDILMLGLAPRIINVRSHINDTPTFSLVTLYRRIDRRLKERLEQGLVEEVKRLHARDIPWKRLESFGLEYKWVSRFLRDRENYETMMSELSRAIKDFARRQMTWFKRDKRIVWVKNSAQARALVKAFLKL